MGVITYGKLSLSQATGGGGSSCGSGGGGTGGGYVDGRGVVYFFSKKLRNNNIFKKIPVTEPVELEPFPWWLMKDILKENFLVSKSKFPPFGQKKCKLPKPASSKNWKKMLLLTPQKIDAFAMHKFFFLNEALEVYQCCSFTPQLPFLPCQFELSW